jgi:ABC-2 type transport system ATP-binding protein
MIRVQNTTKYYGSHCAVRDLDFTIDDGECVGFLGLNGAGKSTTLRLLSCLLLPTSGRVTIRGMDAEAQPHEIRRFIGYLPERPPVYGEMTVREYLVFAGRLRGVSGARLSERLEAVLSMCGLREVAHAPIDTLSHGYKQRVGIGQAVIHEPALLILDEPMQGLDPVQIVEMRSMIRNLRGKHTILLSTHMLHEIEATCDRILVLNEGRVAAHGTEADLAQRFGAGGQFELLVRGDAAAITAALQTINGVTEVELKESGVEVRVTLHLAGEADARADLSKGIVDAGLDLLEMRRMTSGLESIFLGLQERGIAEVGS